MRRGRFGWRWYLIEVGQAAAARSPSGLGRFGHVGVGCKRRRGGSDDSLPVDAFEERVRLDFVKAVRPEPFIRLAHLRQRTHTHTRVWKENGNKALNRTPASFLGGKRGGVRTSSFSQRSLATGGKKSGKGSNSLSRTLRIVSHGVLPLLCAAPNARVRRKRRRKWSRRAINAAAQCGRGWMAGHEPDESNAPDEKLSGEELEQYHAQRPQIGPEQPAPACWHVSTR